MKIGNVMEQSQNELISRLIDDDLDLSKCNLDINTKTMHNQLKRYQLISDVLNKPQTHPIFFIDVSTAVSKAIERVRLEQSLSLEEKKQKSFFSVKIKQFCSGFQNFGMVAAVAVVVLTGVQFLNQDEKDDYSVMNTVPMGIKAVPVGGLENLNQNNAERANEAQYNKIRFLTREYELQKHLNTLN